MNNNTYFKLSLINDIGRTRQMTDEHFSVLKRFASSPKSEIRHAVAETLGMMETTDASLALLTRLAHDPNKFVASEACSSLGEVGGAACIPVLERAFNSRFYLKRGYAALSLAQVAVRVGDGQYTERLKSLLEKKLSAEKNGWTAQSIRYALFELGDRNMLKEVLNGLKSEDPDARLASASLIELCIERHPDAESDIKAFLSGDMKVDADSYAKLLDEMGEPDTINIG